MDLGAITGAIGDLATIYTQVKAAGSPTPQPAFTIPSPGTVYDYFTEDGTVVAASRPKRRRRRRRLATVGDIKDLAALKSVLGNGEAFKTWIATHSR